MKKLKPHEFVSYYKKLGVLDAYIELLRTGIREICIHSYGEIKIKDLDYIDKEAKKAGFRTMLVTYKRRVGVDKHKLTTYNRIIYWKHRKKDACLLRNKMQKDHKDKEDHIVIGRLLGYSEKAINSFIR